MKIIIKVLLGEEYTFDISPANTILEVKEKIHSRLGIEISHQVLLLMGKTLNDSNQISFYPGIKEGSKITLVKKLPQSSPNKNGIHKFKEEIIKVLKNYYTEADALTIANGVIKTLEVKVNQLSYDDLERIATALMQDQDSKI